jgi:hypothetical protein
MEPVAQFVRSKFKATSMLEARVVERFAEAICDAERVKLELKVLFWMWMGWSWECTARAWRRWIASNVGRNILKAIVCLEFISLRWRFSQLEIFE